MTFEMLIQVRLYILRIALIVHHSEENLFQTEISVHVFMKGFFQNRVGRDHVVTFGLNIRNSGTLLLLCQTCASAL